MSVHNFKLNSDIEYKLDMLVEQTGHKKSFFFQEAIKSYIEDNEDYFKAVSILNKIKSGKVSTKPLADIIAKYGIADEL